MHYTCKCDLEMYCQVFVELYPITPHISTCANNKNNSNFTILHREKATDIRTDAYVRQSLSKVYLKLATV